MQTKKGLLPSKAVRNIHGRTATPIQQGRPKKWNAESSEIEKRLQGQNALAGESSFWLQAVMSNQWVVDNKIQAWHPLKVLDTIEIIRFSLVIPDK